jgi:hypothetical protein
MSLDLLASPTHLPPNKGATWLRGWQSGSTPSTERYENIRALAAQLSPSLLFLKVKYVMLAANSSWKGMSDLSKYEKARELKKHIGKIRADYMKGARACLSYICLFILTPLLSLSRNSSCFDSTPGRLHKALLFWY